LSADPAVPQVRRTIDKLFRTLREYITGNIEDRLLTRRTLSAAATRTAPCAARARRAAPRSTASGRTVDGLEELAVWSIFEALHPRRA